MRRPYLIGRFASTAFGLVFSTGLWAAQVSSSYSVDTGNPVDPDLGVRVPAGFEATVFAQIDGYARHMAVRDDGTLYLALTVRMGAGSTMGIVAMQDTDGDGVADITEHFAVNIPGTELRFHDGDLYLGSKTAVYRFNFAGDELVPTGEPEIVVDGFPDQRLHEAKTFAIDDEHNIYINVGAPSNACMEEFRTRGSPGQLPCPHLDIQAGVWRFDADGSGQNQVDDGERFATGIRNAVAIEWSEEHEQVYFLTHGRDALFSLYPDYFTADDSAELPSEEMHVLVEGGNYGWPYSYYDHIQGNRLHGPEYGGRQARGGSGFVCGTSRNVSGALGAERPDVLRGRAVSGAFPRWRLHRLPWLLESGAAAAGWLQHRFRTIRWFDAGTGLRGLCGRFRRG